MNGVDFIFYDYDEVTVEPRRLTSSIPEDPTSDRIDIREEFDGLGLSFDEGRERRIRDRIRDLGEVTL